VQKLRPKARLKRSMYDGQDRGDKSMCRRMTWVEATGGAGKGKKRKEAREGRRERMERGWERDSMGEETTGTHKHTQTHTLTPT